MLSNVGDFLIGIGACVTATATVFNGFRTRQVRKQITPSNGESFIEILESMREELHKLGTEESKTRRMLYRHLLSANRARRELGLEEERFNLERPNRPNHFRRNPRD